MLWLTHHLNIKQIAPWRMLLLFLLTTPVSISSAQTGNKVYLPVIYRIFGPTIGPVTSNETDYPGSQIPCYNKLELTFDVQTVATNLQLPFDANPPAGVQPKQGITIDALFSPDDWQTVYTQPAFYYQEFDHQTRVDLEGIQRAWIYPTGHGMWKVRFSPDQTGRWQYKLRASDARGTSETRPESFTVTASSDKGFVRVSRADPRYFEYDKGELFVGLGYNFTYSAVNNINPLQGNEAKFQTLQENKLQLFRMWLSQWGIFGSAWNGWNSPIEELRNNFIPYESISMAFTEGDSEVSMELTGFENPGIMQSFQAVPVKPNTTYKLTVRYLLPRPLIGPRLAGHPYGFVVKYSKFWLDNFADPSPTNLGWLTLLNSHLTQSPTDASGNFQWATLEATIDTADEQYFLPYLYFVLDNVSDSRADNEKNLIYIDRIEIREDLGRGERGPNVITRPWMSHHLYYEQRLSYAFDRVLELAEQKDLYLKLVISEKDEWIMKHIDFEGNPIPDSPLCWDSKPDNDPAKCPGTYWFYGNWREMTRTRWLQQAWWRYLQARWGYSPHIHSWELVNEGDPYSTQLYTLTDELARYMDQFAPNDHLVSTSFWADFPNESFWSNTKYSAVDYADIHHYIPRSEPFFYDAAEATIEVSQMHGAKQPDGANMPLVRGETGFTDQDTDPLAQEILEDTQGIWLHNFIWAGLNPGGMYEQYWYSTDHIEQTGRDNDLRYHYRPYYNFLSTISLNNGLYQEAAPIGSNPNLRVVGQKDLTNGCAHLWVQNKSHTWKNVVDGVSIPSASSTVQLAGFQPGKRYVVEQWDTYQPDKTQQVVNSSTIVAQPSGMLSISINNLVTDLALKIHDSDGCSR